MAANKNTEIVQKPSDISEKEYQELIEYSDSELLYSIRDEEPPKKVGVAYKVFLAKDGKLYPPMVANPGGEGTPVGVWLNADIGKAAAPSKTGRMQVQGGGKGTNSGKISLAFRPGWHLGDIPLAKQFAKLNPETGKKELFPANFVWAECEYAMDVDYQDEAMSYGYTENGKFRHSYAGLPRLPENGYYRYRTNPNPDTVPWIITGAMKVTKILTDEDTDAICRENGVEPMKRVGGPIDLEKFGIRAGVTDNEDVKFSDRDSSGNLLSPQQQEFFKDSKVRDEEGNLLRVFHGSPKQFTVYDTKIGRKGIYLTPTIELAQSYGKPKSLYANISNPKIIDAENKKANTLDMPKVSLQAEKEGYDGLIIKNLVHAGSHDYEQALWMLAPDQMMKKELIQERIGTLVEMIGNKLDEKLPMWVYETEYDMFDTSQDYLNSLYISLSEDIRSDKKLKKIGESIESVREEYNELRKALSEMEDVDSEIAKAESENYSDIADTVYVAFSPNQIKSTTNTSPTEDADIRFSDRDQGLEEINRILEQENKGLKADLAQTKELLKLQGKVTGGRLFKPESVKAAARNLLKGFGSKANSAEVAKALDEVYRTIAGDDATWDNVMEKMAPVVDMVAKGIPESLEGYAEDILKSIRGTRIYLDDSQKAEAAHAFDSYNNFRRSLFGRIIVSDNANTSLDSWWGSMAEEYPNIFPADTSSGDMPSALVDAIDRLKGMYEQRDKAVLEQDIRSAIYDGFWNVATLETVADKDQKKINALKAKHGQQMQSLKDKKNQQIAELRQKNQEKITSVRAKVIRQAAERAEKQRKKLVDRYEASKAKGVEGRRKTAVRNKIKRVVNDLNHYLLNGSKDRTVLESMRKAVAEALEVVNMDTVGAEERIAKLEAQLKKAEKPEVIQDLTRKIDHVKAMGDSVSKRLNDLQTAYREIKDSADPDLQVAFMPEIADKIQEVAADIGNTSIRDMSLSQLESVYDMYKMVLTNIRDANKLFKAKRSEGVTKAANTTMQEIDKQNRRITHTGKVAATLRDFSWNNEKPVYAFERIGSNQFMEIFKNVRAGEDTWAVDMGEAQAFYESLAEKYHMKDWDMDKQYDFISTSGKEFKLNLDQIMSIYAYSKRPQAEFHLEKGGIVFDPGTEVKLGKKKVNITDSTAYNISKIALAKIRNIVESNSDVKAFADEMQKYLSETMGAKGNEVSLELLGIKLFKEKTYWPLRSAKQYMPSQGETADNLRMLRNAGFTKALVPKASNPIVLTGFRKTWANHVNEMAMYHSFVLPLEDFMRVYNFHTPAADATAGEVSVKATLEQAYGSAVTNYLEQMIKDLNGGTVMDPRTGIANQLISLFKKGAVFASLSVTIQQPSAIARAAAMLDPKYFVGAKTEKLNHTDAWAQLKKYAPVAVIKDMGYFDTGMGRTATDFLLQTHYDTMQEKAKAVITDSEYRDELLSKGPAFADEVAWISIWNACKREIADKYPDMDTDSELFLKTAGERFTDIIVHTQVYDSVLSRSANMRSKDLLMKMATSFMAEPTTSINMIEDAFRKFALGDKKNGGKILGSVIASVILNSLLVSIVYAGRDDDDDKTYAEKYAGKLTSQILTGLNPMTYIPFVKDMQSIFEGYDVRRADMNIITDLFNSYKMLRSDKVTTYKKVEDFGGSIAKIFGLPVKNIMRDVRGIWQAFQSAKAGPTTSAGIGYAILEELPFGSETANSRQFYNAIISGNKEQEQRVRSRYASESAAESAIRKELRANDPRIKAAAQARASGDTEKYMTIAKEIIAEGHFSQDNIVAAINAEMPKEESTGGTSKHKALFNMDEFAEAVGEGDLELADVIQDEIIEVSILNGKEQEEAVKSFQSSAKTAIRESYFSGSLTEKEAEKAMQDYAGEDAEKAGEDVYKWTFEKMYGVSYSDRKDAYMDGTISKMEMVQILMDSGMEREEAQAQVEAYDWEKEVGGSVTTSAVETYKEKCQGAGISRKDFWKVWNAYQSVEPDRKEDGTAVRYSKCMKFMDYLAALPIPDVQKTALASAWYSDKTIAKYKRW